MPSQFPCPHCHAPLRIRNRAFLGKELDCPHCDQPIRIVAGIDEEFVAEPLQEQPLPTPLASFNDTLTPQRISWIVAGILGIVLLAFIWPRGESSSQVAESESLPAESVLPGSESKPPQSVESIASVDSPQPKEVEPPQDVDQIPKAPVAIVKPNDDQLAIEVPLPAPRDQEKTIGQPVGFDPNTSPIEPLLAPDFSPETPIRIDVRKSLDVRVTKFDQSRPIAVREMLTWFEEYLGVPIRVDDKRMTPAQLDRTVTILLEETTFGEVLTSVTEQAGLSYEIRDDKIVLTPSQE